MPSVRSGWPLRFCSHAQPPLGVGETKSHPQVEAEHSRRSTDVQATLRWTLVDRNVCSRQRLGIAPDAAARGVRASRRRAGPPAASASPRRGRPARGRERTSAMYRLHHPAGGGAQRRVRCDDADALAVAVLAREALEHGVRMLGVTHLERAARLVRDRCRRRRPRPARPAAPPNSRACRAARAGRRSRRRAGGCGRRRGRASGRRRQRAPYADRWRRASYSSRPPRR